MNEQSANTSVSLNENYIKGLPAFFELPQSQSQLYRKKISQIFQSFDGLQQFTNKLQQKVDNLLRTQENEFVTSYQSHMTKVQEQFHKIESLLNKQEDRIKYYENQGKMSQLVQKVHNLENESKKLYLVIEKKDKTIKDLILENKVQKDQNKRISGKVKELMKNKMASEVLNLGVSSVGQLSKETEKKEPIQVKSKFFATEIQNEKSLKGQLSRTTDENKIGFTYHLSEKSHEYGSIPKDYKKKQISNLRLKNKKLISFTSKIYQEKSELESIFVDCVNEIKRQVKIRKKIRQCSFQDFRKEDKLNLLVLFVSNQQILSIVFHKIFDKKKIHLNTQQGEKEKDKMRKKEMLPYLVSTAK